MNCLSISYFFCVTIITKYIIYTFCFSNCCSIFDALKLVLLSFMVLIQAFFNLELISTISHFCWHCFHTIHNMDHQVYLETCVSTRNVCPSGCHRQNFRFLCFIHFILLKHYICFLMNYICERRHALKFPSCKFQIECFHKYYL